MNPDDLIIAEELDKKLSPYPNLFMLLADDDDQSLELVDQKWSAFTEAYFNAAETLRGRLLEDRVSFSEAYPCLFMYRHFVELSLKHLIFHYLAIARLRVEESHDAGRLKIAWKEHNLHELLGVLKGLRKRVVSTVKGANLPRVPFLSPRIQGFVEELHQVDPESKNFRYPCNTEGKPNTEAQLWFNLKPLAAGMKDIQRGFRDATTESAEAAAEVEAWLHWLEG